MIIPAERGDLMQIRMRRIAKISACLSLLALAATFADQWSVSAPLRMVSGSDAFDRVRKLTTEIPWYTSLERAQQIAREQDKPIFWVHMLGPLNGMT